MCTAISFKPKDFYFGRTLDAEIPYKSEVTITPRNFVFDFAQKDHYAILGMAYVSDNFPLYYDGMNEKGLCAAGLSFVGNAVYRKPAKDKTNVAAFEFIPYMLSLCGSVKEAKAALRDINITDTPFSRDLPAAALHWMISDEVESITVEAVKEGLKVYENTVGVLTNNPPFCVQIENYERFSHLTPKHKETYLTKEYSEFTRGTGAMGLPGDYTSRSRFVRAAFVKNNSVCDYSQTSGVNQFFHILDSVSVPRGCCLTENGEEDFTRYACCMSVSQKSYYFKTYDNPVIRNITMNKESMDAQKLVTYPVSM